MIGDHELRTRIDARQVFTTLTGDQGKRVGKALQFRSPFRDDGSKPSFTVYADGYKDFGGSGESGDVIDLTARLMNTDRAAAREWLAQFAGGSAAAPRQHDQRTAESEPPPMGWQTIARAAAGEAARYLWSGVPDARLALDYLRSVRRLTDDTIRAAGLGFNPVWKELKYRESGDSDPIKLPPGITIPYDESGAIWAIRVRSIVGNLAAHLNRPDQQFSGMTAPKYMNLTGSRAAGVLYGADRLAQHGGAVLFVEGEFDALLAGQEIGGVHAVTFGGASTAPAHIPARWRAALDTAARVYLALDSDQAGEAAAARLGRALLGAVRLVLPPNVKDVTELAQHGGDLRGWFDQQVTRPPTSADELPQPHESAQPHEQCQPGEAAADYTDGLPHTFAHELLTSKTARAAVPALHAIYRAVHAGKLLPIMSRSDFAGAVKLGQSTAYKVFAILLEIGAFRYLRTDSINMIVRKQRNQPTLSEDRYALATLDELRTVIEKLKAPRAKMRAFRVAPRGDKLPVLANVDKDMIAAIGVQDDQRAARLAALADQARQQGYTKQAEPRRRASWYERKQRAELRERLADETVLPLDERFGIHTKQGYITAFMAAQRQRGVWAGQNRVSLREVHDMTGLSERVVNEYWRRAGYEPEASEPVPVELKIEADQPVTHAIRNLAMSVKGRPTRVMSVDPDTGEIESFAYAGDAETSAAARIEHAITTGRRVILDFNVANTQRVIPDFVPNRASAQKRSTPPEKRAAGDVLPHTPVRPEPAALPLEPAYSPEWVSAQIKLGFTIMGWTTPRGEFINPETGLVLPHDAPALELVELLIGEVPESIKRQRRQRARQRENAMPLHEYRAHMLAIIDGSVRAS